jgi:hypothetical protein
MKLLARARVTPGDQPQRGNGNLEAEGGGSRRRSKGCEKSAGGGGKKEDAHAHVKVSCRHRIYARIFAGYQNPSNTLLALWSNTPGLVSSEISG